MSLVVTEVEALTPASFKRVDVRVASSRPSVGVAGHRLEVASTDRKTTDTGISPFLQMTTLGADGSVVLSLYPDLEATYTFTVRSPNGLPVTVVSGATTRTLRQMTALVRGAPASANPVVELTIAPFESYNLSVAVSTPGAVAVRGRLVDAATSETISGAQIVLYGRTIAGEPGHPLAVSTTQVSGDFSIAVANDTWVEAWAVVSVEPGTTLPVPLTAGRFPSFSLLLLTRTAAAIAAHEHDEQCACVEATPRLPGTAELVSPHNRYSQDIGASCTNFTVPNRSLEEFTHLHIVRTTDPDGELGRVNDSRAVSVPGANATDVATSAYFDATIRQQLTRVGQLNWDHSDTQPLELFQPTTLAHGHLLAFKQVFKADGYSMGDLLYSLPLAPGQKRQIVIHEWNRADTNSRSEERAYVESLDHEQTHDRDISAIQAGTMRESYDANSKSNTQGVSVTASASYAGATVSGGYNNSVANSTAHQDAARETSSTAHDGLQDRTMQSTSALRSQRLTVIAEASQEEQQTTQTEVVANHNRCHAVTVEYFEVLRHFVVEQELADVQECLFVPLLISEFDADKALRWREVLSRYLRARGRDRQDYFTAFSLLADRSLGLFPPPGRNADRTIVALNADLRVKFSIARPADDIEGQLVETNWTPIKDLVNFVSNTVLGFDKLFKPKMEGLSSDERDVVFYRDVAPVIFKAMVKAVRISLRGDDDDADFPVNAEFVVVSGGNDFGQPKGGRPAAFGAPGMAVSAGFSGASSVLEAVRRGTRLALRCKTPLFGVHGVVVAPPKRAQVSRVLVHLDPQASGIQGLMNNAGAKFTVVSASAQYTAGPTAEVTPGTDSQQFSGTLVQEAQLNNDLSANDTVVVYAPLTPEEKFSPFDAANLLVQKLMKHLNVEHLEHYHQVIWECGISPARRFMLLDRIMLAHDAYNQTYARRGVLGKSVASIVENRILAVVGNSLVFPVAKGLNIDPTFEVNPGNGTTFATLLDFYRPLSEQGNDYKSRYRLSVPTAGVFAEAVRGTCNACERIDETRAWRWKDRPLDEPTAIAAANAGSRYQAPLDTTPTDFAETLVRLMEAPESPEATNLGGIYGLLTTAGIFGDKTGLEGGQKNAMNNILKNQELSLALATNATDLQLFAMKLKNGETYNQMLDESYPGEERKTDRERAKKKAFDDKIGYQEDEDGVGSESVQGTAEDILRTPGASMEYTDPEGNSLSVRGGAEAAGGGGYGGHSASDGASADAAADGGGAPGPSDADLDDLGLANDPGARPHCPAPPGWEDYRARALSYLDGLNGPSYMFYLQDASPSQRRAAFLVQNAPALAASDKPCILTVLNARYSYRYAQLVLLEALASVANTEYSWLGLVNTDAGWFVLSRNATAATGLTPPTAMDGFEAVERWEWEEPRTNINGVRLIAEADIGGEHLEQAIRVFVKRAFATYSHCERFTLHLMGVNFMSNQRPIADGALVDEYQPLDLANADLLFRGLPRFPAGAGVPNAPFEAVLLDGSYSATAELCTALAPFTRYVVARVDVGDSCVHRGIDYAAFFADVQARAPSNGFFLTERCVYKGVASQPEVSLLWLDAPKVAEAASAMEDVVAELVSAGAQVADHVRYALVAARRNPGVALYTEFGEYLTLVDTLRFWNDMMACLSTNSNVPAPLFVAIGRMIAAYENAYVIWPPNGPSVLPSMGPIGLASVMAFNASGFTRMRRWRYRGTRFARVSSYLEFLDALFDVDRQLDGRR